MILHGPSKHYVLSGLAIATATVLFTVPLVLRYHVYRDLRVEMTSSDSVLMERGVSSVWCSGIGLESGNIGFSGFLFPLGPPGIDAGRESYNYSQEMALRAGTTLFWRMRLLGGSTLSVWACARLAGASVTWVRGEPLFTKCMADYQEDSGEESLEDSPEDSSSSSFSNETDIKDFECDQAERLEVSSNQSCSRDHVTVGQTFQAPSNDYYYLVFSSADYLDLVPNQIFVNLHLERTTYDVTGAAVNCSEGKECHFPLAIGQSVTLLLEMGQEGEELGWDSIKVTCQPRKGLYFLFYLLFFVILFVSAFQ